MIPLMRDTDDDSHFAKPLGFKKWRFLGFPGCFKFLN